MKAASILTGGVGFRCAEAVVVCARLVRVVQGLVQLACDRLAGKVPVRTVATSRLATARASVTLACSTMRAPAS